MPSPFSMAALAAAFFMSTSQASAECVTPSQVANAFLTLYQFRGHDLVDHLEGARARAFVADFNARPPATDKQADELLIMGRLDVPFLQVAWFLDGCRVDSRPMRTGFYHDILDHLDDGTM